MGTNVALQQPRPRKGLSAHGALARQGVGPNMHLEGTEGNVHFFAVLATELLSRPFSSGAVELLMFGKAGVRRVAFPAVRTLVPRSLSPFFREIFRVSRWGR